MRADQNDALAARNSLFEDLRIDELALRGDFLDRHVLHPHREERLAAEMTPAGVERRAQLALTPPGKCLMQIAHRQPVTGAENMPRKVSKSISPSQHAVFGQAPREPGDDAVERI